MSQTPCRLQLYPSARSTPQERHRDVISSPDIGERMERLVQIAEIADEVHQEFECGRTLGGAERCIS